MGVGERTEAPACLLPVKESNKSKTAGPHRLLNLLTFPCPFLRRPFGRSGVILVVVQHQLPIPHVLDALREARGVDGRRAERLEPVRVRILRGRWRKRQQLLR